MSQPSESVIELRGADIPRSDAANAAPVVRNVNWTIQRGSFWALGAFAGTGKSDLLSTAAGLQRPLAGELALFGHPLKGMSEHELVETRLKVAMVFANGRLFSHMSIADNIALPIQYHGSFATADVQERVRFALKLAGIEPLADKYPRELPRVLHQRVALARALALGPEVLLLDNPLASVDQRNARWWIDFLCAAHAGDHRMPHPCTIVVATDDLRPWLDVAQQFAILRERRFETIGGRDAVKNTSEAMVRELLMPAFAEI